MIPKIIHYCWFGKAEKSDKIKFCMQTWKNLLGDFQLKEWNENDLSLFEKNAYVMEAYQAKKWAFVSDVFRLYALYSNGGVYFDTDVEVKKTFDNSLLGNDFFIGSEKCGNLKNIGTAVIGASKGNKIIKEMLGLYNSIHFVRQHPMWKYLPDDKKYDLTPNTTRLAPVLLKKGIETVYTTDHIIQIYPKSLIFPTDYFCLDSKKSYTVHHFEGSWLAPYSYKNKLVLPWINNSKLFLRKYKIRKGTAEEVFQENEKLIKMFMNKKKTFWCLLKVTQIELEEIGAK